VARLISEPDTGAYDAFNKGLRCATGDAIAFLNSGDTYTSASVVSRMAGILSLDRIDAAFADVLIVDSHDTRRAIRRYSSKRFCPGRMVYGLMSAHPRLLLRAEVEQHRGEIS